MSQFFIKNFLSHSTGKLRKGTLLCLTKFRVSKNFLHEGGRTIFCRLCLTEPKNFVVEPFCVSENFWYRKILWIRRGREGVSQFSIENLLSHSTGKLRKRTLVCLTKIRVSKNFLQEGSSTIFCRLCLAEPKKFVGETFCVSENFWYRKILWIRRGEGVSQFSIENLLSHSTGKLRRRTLLCFRKFLVSKNFMDKKGGTRECH